MRDRAINRRHIADQLYCRLVQQRDLFKCVWHDVRAQRFVLYSCAGVLSGRILGDDFVMNCDFDAATRICHRCGYQATSLPTFRECGPPPEQPWRPVMIGDLVERGLSAVGITKERVERTTGKPCGCKGRQQRLNEAGVKAQLAARAALVEVQKFVLGD